jgi:hypothetical protein
MFGIVEKVWAGIKVGQMQSLSNMQSLSRERCCKECRKSPDHVSIIQGFNSRIVACRFPSLPKFLREESYKMVVLHSHACF